LIDIGRRAAKRLAEESSDGKDEEKSVDGLYEAMRRPKTAEDVEATGASRAARLGCGRASLIDSAGGGAARDAVRRPLAKRCMRGMLWTNELDR
jgi:hypothetical protein